MPTVESHPFEPFFPDGAEVLILGSFPGRESTQLQRADDWFYGAMRNQFWSILELVYGRPLRTRAQKQQLFTEAGLAITDIIRSAVRRDNRNTDENLVEKTYNIAAIDAILQTQRIRRVLFTSRNVEKEFERYVEPLLSPAARRSTYTKETLPSPSPLYQRLTVVEKAAVYRELLPRL
jgi:hypoxanthine-DNA glycosylase